MEYNGITSLGKLKSLNLDLNSLKNQISPIAMAEGLACLDRSSLLDLSLIIDSATDAHLEAIASHCPNLVRLSIQDKNDCFSTSLTSSEIKLLTEKCQQLQNICLTIKGRDKFKNLGEDRIGNFYISFDKESMILKKSAKNKCN